MKEKQSKNNNIRRVFLALLLSILFVHLPLFYFLSHHKFASDNDAQKMRQPKKEQVVMIDLKQGPLPSRIVDIAKPKVQQRPKKASAQSLYNSSVKKETVSGKFSKSKVPYGSKYQKPNPTQKTAKSSQTQQKPPTNKPTQQQKPLDQNKNLSMQQRLRMIQTQQKQEQQQKHASLFNSSSSAKSDPIFKKSVGAPTGGDPGEFFPDYKIGNRTYLNTLANPNIAFFVELRRKFRFTFNPGPVLRNLVNQISRGKIAVVWGVSVDKNGRLSGLTLIRSSGNTAYDYEARRTISASAPFSKPPGHLLTKDQQLHMAWTFVVYL